MLLVRIVAASLLLFSLGATSHHPAKPAVKPTPRPQVSGAKPAPPTDLRRRNAIVMDVDFEESAAQVNADVIDIAGTLQLILDRIAAQTAPTNDFGQARPIIWTSLTGDKECHNSTDAGILEIRVARFVGRQQNFIVIGHQIEEADLSFRLLSCGGQEVLHYPLDPSAYYGEGRFAPYFLSVTGTAATVALLNTRSTDTSIAATVGVVNSYGPLQANIGAHDSNSLRLLALYRLMGNIPGSAVPPPAPGTVAALMSACSFGADPDRTIQLHCEQP